MKAYFDKIKYLAAKLCYNIKRNAKIDNSLISHNFSKSENFRHITYEKLFEDN